MNQYLIKSLLDDGKASVAAGVYIAAICYPFDQAATDKYWLAQRAFIAKVVRDNDDIYIDDEARTMRARTMHRCLEKTAGILLDRLKVATEVAMPVDLHGAGNAGLFFRGAKSQHSAIRRKVAWRSDFKGAKQQHADVENYRRRKLEPAKPVMHLAWTMANHVNWKPHKDAGALCLQFLILQPEWVRPALQDSVQCLAHLRKHRPDLTGDDSNTVIFAA